MTRGVDDLLADLAEAADAAAEFVSLGMERWDTERPLRLAGEAVIGRLGDQPESVLVTPRSSECPAASRGHWTVGRPSTRHCSPVFRQN